MRKSRGSHMEPQMPFRNTRCNTAGVRAAIFMQAPVIVDALPMSQRELPHETVKS